MFKRGAFSHRQGYLYHSNLDDLTCKQYTDLYGGAVVNKIYEDRLVHALSNRALVEDDILKRAEYALECYEALLKILKDMDVKAETAGNLRNNGGEFSNAVYNISMFTRKKDRKAVFEKVYGDGTDAKAKPAQKEKKRGLFRRR